MSRRTGAASRQPGGDGDASQQPLDGSGRPQRPKMAPSATRGRQKRVRPAYWPTGVDSELEMALLTRLERAGLPVGEGQYRFIEGRQHRFDRAWPPFRVAVEVMGGIWVKSGHTTGKGIERDCLKASMAAALGWRCLPVTKTMIEDGTAVELIRQALEV